LDLLDAAAVEKAEMSDSTHRETTKRALEDDMATLEAEIGRQRLIREKATYRLERLVREKERLACHLASLVREEPRKGAEI